MPAIYSLIKHLWNTYYVSSTILGTEDKVIDKVSSPLSCNLNSSGGTDIKHENK